MDRGNGIVIDGPDVNNQWFTDGYGDYIRHFLMGFAAIPEWAPSDANHMTDSTSLVTAISYGPTAIAYTTRDASSTETLRLVFVPQAVVVGGQPLSQRSDLSQPGWTHDPTTGVLRIRHDNGSNVLVSAPEAAPLVGGLGCLVTLAAIAARRRGLAARLRLGSRALQSPQQRS